MTAMPNAATSTRRSLRAPLAWGAVVGVIRPRPRWPSSGSTPRMTTPLGLVEIAAVHIGFAVADGRRHVLASRRSSRGWPATA
jgi:hypothetical protein